MRILHPTDFSRAAEGARAMAVDLAGRLSATVHVVHVQQRFDEAESRSLLTSSAEALNVELLRRIEEARQAETKHRRERLASLTPPGGSYDLRWGNPVRELLEILPGFDLVVMGAHGANPLDRFFLGGVAGRVVRRSTVPVLTVRPEAAGSRLGRILVATDLGESSRAAWRFAASLAAEGAGLDLVLVHVIDDRRHENDPLYAREVAEAMSILADGHAARQIVREGDPVALLPDIAAEAGADAIAIGMHRHPAALGLLLGSRADALLRSSPVPILGVPFARG